MLVRGLAAFGSIAALALAGCGGNPPPVAKTPAPPDSAPKVVAVPPAAEPVPPSPIRFERVDQALGVKFRQTSGDNQEKHFPAANGSGVAMFDFDLDGRMDLYFLTGRPMPFEPGSAGPRNGLFRNSPSGPWTDVAAAAGLDLSAFCHGVCAADFDDDGFPDLAISRCGGTRLLRNNGDGTFSVDPRFRDDRWGSSLAAADIDRDGRLDLYVTHYGYWLLSENPDCRNVDDPKTRRFCSPSQIKPREHALYVNKGDGSFEDRFVQWGMTDPKNYGRGQGVTACDLDDNGWVDFWVANDQCPNFVYLATPDGRITDHSSASGAATAMGGAAFAGMGTDVGDVDRDGMPDLFVTNFSKEYNTLLLNSRPPGFFQDVSHQSNLAQGSRNSVNWGTRLADFDNDGWLDVLVVSGHVDDQPLDNQPRSRYRTPAQLWRNLGVPKDRKKPAEFLELKDGSPGPYFQELHNARGAAFGDFDNDGWLDFAVNSRDEAACVVRNVTGELPAHAGRKPWVRVRLVGRRGARDAIGARITALAPELPKRNPDRPGVGCIVEWVRSGGSYLSSSDPRTLIGIGAASKVALEIRWPSGAVSRLPEVAGGSELFVLEPLDP